MLAVALWKPVFVQQPTARCSGAGAGGVARAGGPPGVARRRRHRVAPVTSVGKGDGANLGDLPERAYRQALATAARQSHVARLFDTNPQGQPAVNARDRIGNGPHKRTERRSRRTRICTAHARSARITLSRTTFSERRSDQRPPDPERARHVDGVASTAAPTLTARPLP